MATDTADPVADESTTPPAPSGGGKKKLIIIIAAVMMVEAIGLYLVLGRGGGAEAKPVDGAETETEEAAPESDIVEVPIDSFMCTNNKAASGSIIHITFKLVAVVPTGQKVAFDKAANQDNKARVRQAIVKVARSSSMDDLTDAELTTMKRLFREEINKVLRKSYVTEVVISDFKTIEQ